MGLSGECVKLFLLVIRWLSICCIVIIFPTLSTAREFRTLRDQVEFLGYLRRAVPELYQEFIVRSDAILFFETAQQVIDAVGFQSNARLNALEFDIYDTRLIPAGIRETDLDQFRTVLRSFIETYPVHNSPQLKEALESELKKAAPLDGLIAALMQTGLIPNLPDVIKMTPKLRLPLLSELLRSRPEIVGVSPRRLGLDKAAISGEDAFKIFETGMRAQEQSTFLLMLWVLSREFKKLGTELADPTLIPENLTPPLFLSAFSPENFRRSLDDVAKEISLASAQLTKAKLHRSLHHIQGRIRPLLSLEAGELKLELTLRRTHPFEAYLRGEVGDCSTDASPSIPIAPKEEIYWIRFPETESSVVKGYLQFTHVKTNGIHALYVNTISGPELTRENVRKIFATLFEAMGQLGAEKIIIPRPELLESIINFPEILLVFKELANTGKLVPIDYIDGEERQKIAAFSEVFLDLPDLNREGMEIQREALTGPTPQVKIQKFEIDPDTLFPPLSRQEALIIALELRNRETNSEKILEVLKLYEIPAQNFQQLWQALSNQKKLSIAEFHAHVLGVITELGVPVEWESFKHLPLLFRGHFAAADALTGPNFSLASEYFRTYLLSNSSIDAVFRAMAPKFPQLIERQEFVSVVKYLFRRNIKELSRLLDSYELENKSAYRTIIKLFTSGLSLAPFKTELAELNRTWENMPAHSARKNGVFVRRKTLLGMIEPLNSAHFTDLMDYLEGMAQSNETLEADDLRTVSNYFSSFMERERTTQHQVDRIYNFLKGSEFGLSFTQSLGEFKIERLNVPGLVTELFRANKFLWAAHLIHKDPWPRHAQAPHWLNTIWSHREQVGDEVFLDGLRVNPSLVEVPGFNFVLDSLLATARKTIGNETIMARALIRHPEKLTTERLEWLANVSSEGTADLILAALPEPAWLRKKLRDRFPKLGAPNCEGDL